MEWVWNERKARANLTKHGIDLAVAAFVFRDPNQISEPDEHPDDDRWRTIGLVNAVMLFVVRT